MILSKYFSFLLDTLLPRNCPVCGNTLNYQEVHVCVECMLKMPRTLFHLREFNAMEQLFAGKTPIVQAVGYFFYHKESAYSSIIHDIKYHNQPKMARWLACEYAKEIKDYKFFDTIDCIIPVPLHRKKLAKRGYNQSESIAHGISQATNIPVLNAIIAIQNHETQTHKGLHERWLNTQGLFVHDKNHSLEGEHILIVDDVITTGATLLACAEALKSIPKIKISLLTLGVSKI